MKKSPLLFGSVFLVHLTAIAAMVVLQGCAGFQKRSNAPLARSSSGSSGGPGFFQKFKSNRDRSYRTASTSRISSSANYGSSSTLGSSSYGSSSSYGTSSPMSSTRVDRQIEFPPRHGQASAFSSDRVNAVSTPQLQSVTSTFSAPKRQSSSSYESFPVTGRASSVTSSAMGAGMDPSFDSSGAFSAQGGSLIGSSPSVSQVISQYEGQGGQASKWTGTQKSFGAPSQNTSFNAPAPSIVDGGSMGLRSITVRKGDNLTKIARREGVSVKQLKAWNSLKSDRIDVGQKLSLGGVSKAAAPVSTWKPKRASVKPTKVVSKSTSSSSSKPSHKRGVSGVKYKVQSGDNLSTIAFKHGVKTSSLKSANNISSDRIQVGWELLVPSPTKVVASSRTPTPAVKPTGRAQYESTTKLGTPVARTFPLQTGIGSVVVPAKPPISTTTFVPTPIAAPASNIGSSDGDDFTYVVLEGDSISSIAATFITTTDQLRKRNPGVSDPLTVGTQIVIPPLD